MCFDFRRARSHPLAPTIHRPLYRVGRQCTRQKKAMSRQRRINFTTSDEPYWLSAMLPPLRGTT
jgi:hypothetical protein